MAVLVKHVCQRVLSRVREAGELMDEFLREAMRDRHWSIPQLAEACDANPGLVARWVSRTERYRVTPSPASCEKIAAALGVDVDYVLELAGHRKAREPMTAADAKRQAVRDQLDRWLSAVGPEYESYFWQSLKAHGDAAAAFIAEIRTAVSTGAEGAVNGAVSIRGKGDRAAKNSGKRPLRQPQHGASEVLEQAMSRALAALTNAVRPNRRLLFLPGPPLAELTAN